MLLETKEADERAVEQKLLETRHTTASMESLEAQVARQKPLEEELASVRAALLTSLRCLKSFGTPHLLKPTQAPLASAAHAG